MPELMDANAVVRAGGIARKGAKTEAATTGDLVGKAFTHPAMAGRVVVRLVEESLDGAVDAEMGVLGFGNAGEASVVGRTTKRALGFPAWALVNHPNKARFALEVMRDFRKAATRAKTKPGHAKDAFMLVAKKLERSVPPFMPSFWEEVGRVFLGEDATTFAAQCFEKARTAEREYKLSVDEDRRAAAYLEFTAAGAVPAKSLAGYADDLLAAFGAKEAERRFVELNLHRIKAGVPPWTGMAKELTKLAKAAKRGPEADGEFLRDVLSSPALKKAPPDFWASYRTALVELAKSGDETRERVQWLFPEPRGFRKFLPTWLTLLDEVGAVAAMEKSAEAGRWFTALTRFVTYSDEWGHSKEPIPELYFDLLKRLAPRLIALGQPVVAESYRSWGDDGEYSSDILEAVLEAGLKLATPAGEDPSLDLADVFVKDPVRVAAHPEYSKLLETAVGNQFGREQFEAKAKGKAGLVTARKNYLMARVAELDKGALPALKEVLETITEKTTAATFVEFPEALAVVEKLDISKALGKSIRGGLFDELAWPEFEAALKSLAGPKTEIALHGTMQNPIVRANTKVIVFEGKSRLREFDLPATVASRCTLVYLDGDLLVSSYDRKAQATLALWMSDPKDPFPTKFNLGKTPEAVALPDGGVTLGGACIHKGDRPEKIGYTAFATDGTKFWSGRAHWREAVKLTELDPRTGALGRASWPEMVREVSEKSDGMFLQEVHLMPAPKGAERSLFGVKDGLVGMFIRRDEKKERFEFHRIDGKVREASVRPDQLVDWPGKDGLQMLSVSNAWSDTSSDEVAFWDDEGHATGTYGEDEWPCAGFSMLPREPWLHFMEVRDLGSSQALRAATDEALAKILAVATTDEDEKLSATLAAVKTHLPGVTNDVIAGGVARVVKVATERVTELAAILDRTEGGGGTLSDDAFEKALPQFPTEGYEDGFAATDMKVVADAFKEGKRGKLTASRICWEKQVESLAKLACFVASRKGTGGEERQTLVDLLQAFAQSGLMGMTVTRAELVVKTGAPLLTRPKGKEVWLASEGETFLFVRMPDEDEDEPTQKVSVLVHGATLTVPKEATLTSHETVTIPDDRELVTAFLAELAKKGPAPHDLTAAPFVAGATGLTPAEAVLLVEGLPKFGVYQHDFLGKELREALGLKVTDANRAKEKLRQLPDGQLASLLDGAANVARAKDYWSMAETEGSVARALVTKAKALFGKNVVVREELVLVVEKELSLDIPVRKALALLLTASESPALLTPRKGPVPWDDIGDSGEFFCADVVTSLGLLIPYLSFNLPVGDEYRQKIPELHGVVAKLLDDPELLLPMGSRDEEDAKKRAVILDQIGGKKITMKRKREGEDREARDNGLIQAVEGEWGAIELAVHTAKIRTDRTALLPYLAQSRSEGCYGTEAAAAAFYLLSKECEALVKRVEKTPVPEGSFEANPLLSAKGTVKKMAEAAGIDEAAAALYLQMLALPNPTKKLVLRMNGWKPAEYDKAAQALVKKKLCIEGERERAGRDIFLPGGWDKKSRGISMETYKMPLYDRALFEEPVVSGPVHTLYDKAFERWSSGDRPGFEDVTKKKK